MSTDRENPGGKMAAAEALENSKAMLEAAAAEEEQLELIEPLTAEELEEARDAIGHGAGMVSVMREARKRRRGRPKNARNRRTADFENYLRQFGADPAVGLMQIASSTPEELVARSRLLDPPKRQLSYGDALDRIIRCREALMPYLHGKKPVQVDATIRGVMVVEEIGQARPGVVIDADEPLGLLPIDDREGDE